MSTIAILGGGMAGLGAAHFLDSNGLQSILFEQRTHLGGHASSQAYESGFTFDEGPHVSFTKDVRIQQLFAQSVRGQYETLRAQVNNYWRGRWIPHPAQCNLRGLPDDLIDRIVEELRQALTHPHSQPQTYEEWLVAAYGRTFAELFPMTYGRKYHTTPASNMTVEWIGPRMYRPTLEEVIRGTTSESKAGTHYVNEFRYPSKGGFGSYLQNLAPRSTVRVAHELVHLDSTQRTLTFRNGEVAAYDQVISSLPLPNLVPMIADVPDAVVDAARRLAATTCVVVNLGVNRPDLSESHWTYFYDPEIVFSRVSFPHMLSARNAPQGAGSIQAEIYFSQKYRPLDRKPEAYIDTVIADLRRCGVLREDDHIMFKTAVLIPYANVIFDLERVDALARVHAYLDEIGVVYCGRYGKWNHFWTDESFIDGELAAARVVQRL